METIRIGPLDFKYEECEELHDDGKKLDGWIRYSPCTIKVLAGACDQFKRLVLWHEIIHGILYMTGRDGDEALIDALAGGVMSVLRDNPELRNDIEQVKT
jgi:hypothetical protein